MPNSMTAFARSCAQPDWGEISCEIRSINHRYLEPSIRLPECLRALDPVVREALRKQLSRGKVDVSFQLASSEGQPESMSVNADLLKTLLGAVEQVQALHTPVAPVDAVRLLQFPGVIEQGRVDNAAVMAVAEELLQQALAALLKHRAREGKELHRLIDERMTQIADLVAQVRANMPLILRAQRDKLQQRLGKLAVELDKTRVEQEAVLLANKADVAEELDRLDTHLAEVRHILNKKGPIGRRLDFMMQELNREANTLSAKSINSEVTQIAVSLKVLIEQMREQIQNME